MYLITLQYGRETQCTSCKRTRNEDTEKLKETRSKQQEKKTKRTKRSINGGNLPIQVQLVDEELNDQRSLSNDTSFVDCFMPD